MLGLRHWLARLQGSSISADLRAYAAPLDTINRLESEIQHLSDADLRDRARDGGRPLVYALVREAARRSLGLRPFDVQVVAALALDEGNVVEMQTGEGKTLAAVMPAALNALSGLGVHVLTFNDYLARRDAEWMRPIYQRLGLTVAFVQQGMTAPERRRAYLADVTYLTAKEAGFDHLRDLLAASTQDVVHRPFHFALVDEADSILIDEARSPLVIAGSVGRATPPGRRLAELVASLERGVHFDQDEYGRDVEFTEAGFERVEALLGCGSLHGEKTNYTLLTELNCALHAHVLLRRDVDYIVRNGRIEMVDEFTGRVVNDRHWPDGLQAAVEAKERIEQQPDGRILGSITLQHFLRGYSRLCGMTGTARDAAEEFAESYGLGVVVVPTHRPMVRVDHPDVVFTHREAKEHALVSEIQRVHASGGPVLVGTLTVEESERLAADLRADGVVCEVLNAKNDEREAHVVARAGALGAVTISTNMAGRGTDIRLGEDDEAERGRVEALGGLYVIGTNRHESRRIDLQLRGRAGRQGDPGASRFFVSLEDDLLMRYGIASLIPARLMPARSDRPIDHPVVNREIARAQRIIEGQNLEIRRTLSRYASLVENQRRIVMGRREAVLHDGALPPVERAITLHYIDAAWREHLAFCADLREGIHLTSLGGLDPLTRFSNEVAAAFHGMEGAIDAAVGEALDRFEATGEAIDIKGPSSTWTYLVNDDPFRHQIAMRLMGPGKTTLTIGAALFATPLLLLWTLVDWYARKRNRKDGRSSRR